VVTDEEFLLAREQLLADPALIPPSIAIWDFHAVSEARVSQAVVAQLVAASPNSEKRSAAPSLSANGRRL